MPQRDLYHQAVRNALTRDGWMITSDPYYLTYGGERGYVDLGATGTLAATLHDHTIAVEVKSFLGPSPIAELEQAIGQYLVYASWMRRTEDRLMETLIASDPTKQARYCNLVRQLIEHDAQTTRPSHGEVEALVLIDERQGSYMLLYLGWSGNVRHHDSIIHARVRDGKVWIEHDGTSEGFANALTAAGIPAEDIVLAFHHPRKRPYTGFAAG